MLSLITHAACLAHSNGPGHPESRERLVAVQGALDLALVKPGHATWLEAPLVSDADALLVHSGRYLERLKAIDAAGGGALDPDTGMGPGSLEAARRAAGAAVLAAERAMKGKGPAFCAVRPPGHHATPARAMGFCLLNNAAIAAAVSLARLSASRVLIVDWDVHHGNGTADAFRMESRVHYVSMHQWPYYPGTGLVEDNGCGNLFHVPRGPGLPAEVYVRDLLDAVDAAVAGFAPDLVIHSAGFDAMLGDPLGGFTLEPDDYAHITRAIAERTPGAAALGVMEGGYAPERIAEAAVRHAAALAGEGT